MRTKKIRGHKRIWKDIDHWHATYKNLDLDYLKEYQRDYAKIRVHPWSGISLTNSQIPEPSGETKIKILHGLIDIYEAWKNQLDKLGENYYLKIWLFEPRFSNSQVVCAIGESIDFYENIFFKPDYSKEPRTKNYGRLQKEISGYKWEYRLDEDHFDKSDLGIPELYTKVEDYEADKREYEKRLKKPHRTTKFKEPIGEVTESHSIKKGDIWLGEK